MSLRILQILPELNDGGVERGTLEVAAALVARGHEAWVMSAGGRMVPKLAACGARHLAWPVHKKSPRTLRFVHPLRRLLRDERIDVLHVRSRVPAWVAWLAWRGMPQRCRPRFVTTAHGLYSVNRYSAVMTRGERVIAISETVRDYLKNNYPHFPHDRIQVIYRGVDAAEFPRGYQSSAVWLDRWRSEFPQFVGRPLVTLPGRLTRVKGHHAFIEVIDRLRRIVPEVHGVIVGGEDPNRLRYAAEIRELVRERGLEGSITFTGHRSDIREIYSQSAAVVSLSADPPEAFGRTTLEALCIGAPVVGYSHSGVGEILRNMYPAGAVASGDIAGAVERLAAILEGERPVIGDNELFTRRRMLDETIALYEQLAAEREAKIHLAPARPKWNDAA